MGWLTLVNLQVFATSQLYHVNSGRSLDIENQSTISIETTKALPFSNAFAAGSAILYKSRESGPLTKKKEPSCYLSYILI
jgi:hypothetical protein